MAKALKGAVTSGEHAGIDTKFTETPRDWRKSMSDNVAYALIVYTALHIFLTMGAMKQTGFKSMALLALVVLVIGIIPVCRSYEKRWRNLSDLEAADIALSNAFRRDQKTVWLMALGLPFALTCLFKLMTTVI